MIDSHHRLCCGPESKLFLDSPLDTEELAERFHFPVQWVTELSSRTTSRAEFIERFFTEYCEANGKARWAEKTPRNVTRLAYLFESFPKAQFLHVIRDGRDVACSLRTHPRYKVVEGQLVPRGTCNSLDDCITRWINDVTAARVHRNDPRYLEVRYEDLVSRPRATLQQVMHFIGEPWDEAMLDYHTSTEPSRDVRRFPQNPEAVQPLTDESVGRWVEDLSKEDLRRVEEHAGRLLSELGYKRAAEW